MAATTGKAVKIRKPTTLGARNIAAATSSRSRRRRRARPRGPGGRRRDRTLTATDSAPVLDVLRPGEQVVELRLHVLDRLVDARIAEEDRRDQLLGEHHVGLLPGGRGPERARLTDVRVEDALDDVRVRRRGLALEDGHGGLARGVAAAGAREALE